MFISSCPPSLPSHPLRFLLITCLMLIGSPLWGAPVPFSDAQALGASVRLGSWADVDGDGDPDFLGEVGSTLVWLENGAAWSSHAIGAVDTAGSVQAADMDGDGDLDVLVASTAPAEIAWWENAAGDGTSWAKQVVGSGSRGVAADLDRDGDLDIAALASGLVWLENTAGDGSAWSSHVVDAVATASELSAHDLDRDGDVDLIGWGQDIGWWQSSSDGGTWTRHDIELGIDAAESVAVADVDGDGDDDVLAGTFVDMGGAMDHRTGWWENTAGDGSVWSEHHEQAGDTGFQLSAADVDGDGDVDFVRAFELGAVDWWENLGAGGTWGVHSIDAGAAALGAASVGDPDRDGDLDVVALHGVDGSVIFENLTLHRKAHYPVEIPIDDAFTNALSVAAGDFDGDGDLDVAAGSSNGLLSWWENTAGDASSWSEHTVATDAYEVLRLAVADLDGDGDLDLAAGEAASGGLRWWQNHGDGSAWTDRSISQTFADPVALRVVDMDGDGDLDVLAASFGSGLRWWENAAPVPRAPNADGDGDGTTWIEHTVVGGFFYAQSVDAADMDGDGDLDVVGPDTPGDAVHWWENTAGDGSAWSQHDVVTGVDRPTEVRAADFNGDGLVDVVASTESNGILRWQNDGSGGWSQRLVSLSSSQDLHVADVDGDGDPDVLGPQTLNGGRLNWWRNENGGLDWYAHNATNGLAGGSSAMAADLDGDGELDLVGAARTDGTVSWWPNLGGQAELIASNAAPAGSVAPGAEDVPLLTLTARHHGRLGDDEIELAEVVLRFERSPGNPMTEGAVNDLIESLHIYRDDALLHTESGPFTVGTGGLESGALSLLITDDAPGAALPLGADDVLYSQTTFSVTADLATFTSPPGPGHLFFRVGLLVEADHERRSTVEMRSEDLPLSLVDPRDRFSSLVSVETEPDVALNLSELSFGRHAITAGASPTIDLVITNEGSETLLGVTVQITGDDAADFDITSDTGQLNLTPGHSRNVSVVFDPSTVGAKLADLWVQSNDPDSSFLILDLSGTGIDPEITVTPSALDFGVTAIGEPSAYQTVSIENEGTTDMAILGLELVGVDAGAFEILDASPGLLDVGETRTVEVRFTPDTLGAYSAQLRITSDDGDEGTVDVGLAGYGDDPIFADGFESGDLSAWTVDF